MDRREYIVATGAGLAGGVASCSGQSEADNGGDSGTDTATESGTTAAASTDSGYSVSMEPVGEVSFESVPDVWVANNGSWADMGIAVGLDAPEGVWLPSRYHTRYYDEIPGVSADGSSIRELWGDSGVGKEQFYEMDADIHVMDPNFLLSRGSWDQSDIDEIETQIAPFFGNSVFSTGYEWHDYTYYTLYEAFEKLSQAFQRTDRFDAFRALHEEFRTVLEDIVPETCEEL